MFLYFYIKNFFIHKFLYSVHNNMFDVSEEKNQNKTDVSVHLLWTWINIC